MSERMRWLIVVLVGIASVIVAVAVTVWIVDGGAPSAAARVTVVRPGASSPGVAFHGYQYRTSSRFGEQVLVSVGDGTVYVTGPARRTPRLLRLHRHAHAHVGARAAPGTGRGPVPQMAPAVVAAGGRRGQPRARRSWGGGSLGAAQHRVDPGAGGARAGLVPRLVRARRADRPRLVPRRAGHRDLAVRAGDRPAGQGPRRLVPAPSGDSGRYVVYAMHFYTPAEVPGS